MEKGSGFQVEFSEYEISGEESEISWPKKVSLLEISDLVFRLRGFILIQSLVSDLLPSFSNVGVAFRLLWALRVELLCTILVYPLSDFSMSILKIATLFTVVANLCSASVSDHSKRGQLRYDWTNPERRDTFDKVARLPLGSFTSRSRFYNNLHLPFMMAGRPDLFLDEHGTDAIEVLREQLGVSRAGAINAFLSNTHAELVSIVGDILSKGSDVFVYLLADNFPGAYLTVTKPVTELLHRYVRDRRSLGLYDYLPIGLRNQIVLKKYFTEVSDHGYNIVQFQGALVELPILPISVQSTEGVLRIKPDIAIDRFIDLSQGRVLDLNSGFGCAIFDSLGRCFFVVDLMEKKALVWQTSMRQPLVFEVSDDLSQVEFLFYGWSYKATIAEISIRQLRAICAKLIGSSYPVREKKSDCTTADFWDSTGRRYRYPTEIQPPHHQLPPAHHQPLLPVMAVIRGSLITSLTFNFKTSHRLFNAIYVLAFRSELTEEQQVFLRVSILLLGGKWIEAVKALRGWSRVYHSLVFKAPQLLSRTRQVIDPLLAILKDGSVGSLPIFNPGNKTSGMICMEVMLTRQALVEMDMLEILLLIQPSRPDLKDVLLELWNHYISNRDAQGLRLAIVNYERFSSSHTFGHNLNDLLDPSLDYLLDHSGDYTIWGVV